MSNDTAFEVTFDGFQSESDDQDDDEISLDHETQATGMLNMPCGNCTCTVSITRCQHKYINLAQPSTVFMCTKYFIRVLVDLMNGI